MMDIVSTEQADTAGDAKNTNMMRNVAVTCYGSIIFMIMFLNIVIVIGIVRARLVQKAKVNGYLLSLVISRMLIATFVVPAQITAFFSAAYIIGPLCKLCHFTALGSSAVSVTSTTAIAIAKYRELFKQKGHMSTKIVSRDVIIIWVIGHVYSIRAAIFNDLFYDEDLETWRCGITPEYTTVNSYFLFVDMVCMFVIPLCVVAMCYDKLFKGLSATDSRAMAFTKVSVTSTAASADTFNDGKQQNVTVSQDSKRLVVPNAPSNKRQIVPITPGNTQHMIHARNKKSIQMIVMIVSLFIICSVAPLVLKLYRFFADPFPQYPLVELILFIINYSNAWMNAIVILVYREDIRRGIKCKAVHESTACTVMSNQEL